MDLETEASSSPETPEFDPTRAETKRFFDRLRETRDKHRIRRLENLVFAQSRAIDNILARLVVLDKSYDPTTQLPRLDAIQEARDIADQVKRERPEVDRPDYDRYADE
jgi:hypothetical protein